MQRKKVQEEQNSENIICRGAERISNMLCMFPESGIRRFIDETREHILPLMKNAKSAYPEYNDAIFLIRYHMTSVMNSVSSMIR